MTPEERQALRDVHSKRVEELLLELISERLLKHKPPSKGEVEADDKRMTDLDYPPTETELAHRKGYDMGWWDCYQALSDIIDAHTSDTYVTTNTKDAL